MDDYHVRETCPSDPMCPIKINVPSKHTVNPGASATSGHVGHMGHVAGVPALLVGLFVDYLPSVAPLPQKPNDVNDAPDDDLDSTVNCGFCGSNDVLDESLGLRCDSCGHLAWIDVDGALTRAGWHDHDDRSMAPSDLPVCPSCGELCDTQTCDDEWHCSQCSANAETRRKRTKRLLENAKRIRGPHNDVSPDLTVDDPGTFDDATARFSGRKPSPMLGLPWRSFTHGCT